MTTETIKPFEHEYHTQIKNYVLDEIMPRISSSAWKVLCVVMRQTLGWVDGGSPTGRKEWDWISHSQFRKKTGIASDTTIAKALKECMTAKYILRHETEIKGQDRYYYSLNRNLEIKIDTPHRKWGGSPTENGDTKRNYTKEKVLLEPELVPTGEEFTPPSKITKRKIVRPGPRIKQGPLSPSTPGAKRMFEVLARESRASNRKAPQRFRTLAQKEKFEKAESVAGEKINEYITRAVERGANNVTWVTDYVAVCTEEKPRAKTGEVLDCDEWCEGMPPRLKAGETLIISAPPVPTSINPGG